jgi:hypothetical protein
MISVNKVSVFFLSYLLVGWWESFNYKFLIELFLSFPKYLAEVFDGSWVSLIGLSNIRNLLNMLKKAIINPITVLKPIQYSTL